MNKAQYEAAVENMNKITENHEDNITVVTETSHLVEHKKIVLNVGKDHYDFARQEPEAFQLMCDTINQGKQDAPEFEVTVKLRGFAYRGSHIVNTMQMEIFQDPAPHFNISPDVFCQSLVKLAKRMKLSLTISEDKGTQDGMPCTISATELREGAEMEAMRRSGLGELFAMLEGLRGAQVEVFKDETGGN